MQARDELTVVPRWAVVLPLEVPTPPGFRVEDPETWPRTPGRFEYAGGRLWFMPPCGDEQQQTVADAALALGAWREGHREFVVGTNEAGMLLGGEVRGADVAVWRRADLGTTTGGFPRVAPVLVIEVAGRDDTIAALRDKARWYLNNGVAIVWILDPASRTVVIIDSAGEQSLPRTAPIAERPELPGLRVSVEQLFRQIDGR